MERKISIAVLILLVVVSIGLTSFAFIKLNSGSQASAADPPPGGGTRPTPPVTVSGWITRAEFITTTKLYKVTFITCANSTLYLTQKNINDTTGKKDLAHYTGPATIVYTKASMAISKWTINELPACDTGKGTWVYGRVLSYVDIPSLMSKNAPAGSSKVRVAVCKSTDKLLLNAVKIYVDNKSATQLGGNKTLSTYRDCAYFLIAKNANGTEYISKWMAWLGDCCDECNWQNFEITSSSKKVITGPLFNTTEYTIYGKLCGSNGQTTYKTFKMTDMDGFKPVDNNGKYSLPGYTGCTRICLMPGGTKFYKWRAFPNQMPCCPGECSWTNINITGMDYHATTDMGDSNYWIVKAKKCVNGVPGTEMTYRLPGDFYKKDIKGVTLTKAYKGCARACIQGTTIMFIELTPNKKPPCCQ
jgi:hypothetical protein